MAGKLSNIRVKEFPDLNLDFEVMSPIEIGLTDLPDIKVGVTDLPDIRFGVTELPPLDIKTDSDLRTINTPSRLAWQERLAWSVRCLYLSVLAVPLAMT